MQTLTIIKTIRWIDSLIDTETKDIFMGLDPIRTDQKTDVPLIAILTKALHQIASAAAEIRKNPDAVEILKAFSLDIILDGDVMADLTSKVVMGDPNDRGGNEYLKIIVPNWKNMIACVDPIDLLNTPDELKRDEKRDDIISLEIRYREDRRVDLSDLSKVAGLLQKAYETVADIYGKSTKSRLSIIKMDSGSAIRIDCKGIGEVVKHLKDFYIEAWNKLRHKRAEEIIANNKAMLSSLAVMDRIATLEKDKSIGPEKAELLRRGVLDSTLGLFECGALLTEIPSQETVDNSLLLETFSPRLLEAPKEKSTLKPSRKRKAAKRSPKKIKRKKKAKTTRSSKVKR